MLPGCCHCHISANSVPYLKPQKTEGRIGVLAWPELDFCKEEKGEERTFETWMWLREPVTSGTFIEWHFIPTTHLKKVFLHCKPTEFLFFRHGTISSICPRPP